MEIRPSEISEVETIGELDQDEVKLVRTLGGLYIAVGKPKGKTREEVLAAGSHPGIVKYNIQKNFQTFRPALEKSEKEHEEVIGFSELLPEKLRKNGYDLYVLEKHNKTDIMITKHSLDVATLNLSKSGDSDFNISIENGKIPEGAGKAVAMSISKYAEGESYNVNYGGKKFVVKK